jgi:hypothetical protein
MELTNPALKSFNENGFWKINGFTFYDVLLILEHLEQVSPKSGGVCEIGVHHGQFYFALNSLIEDVNDLSFAVDIFDSQHLNIDSSGKGSKEAFIENAIKYDRHQGKNTVLVQGDSTDSSLRLVDRIGPGKMRYVSIDGGHTPEHTVNDLRIANQIISNQGIVILDDILHCCWMGVLEGTIEFLKSKPTLVPFALGGNKLFLCKLSYQQFYLDHMMTFTFRNTASPRNFFGHKIVPCFA